MADFCQQCAPELGDLTGLCKPGEIIHALCECCGPTLVDEKGNCLFKDCICRRKIDCMTPGAHMLFDENNPGNTMK